MKSKKAISYIHALLTIALALFFIYKGFEKFGPVKLREKNIKIENQEIIVRKIFIDKDYAAPYGYDLTMNTMRQSGFLKVIGCIPDTGRAPDVVAPNQDGRLTYAAPYHSQYFPDAFVL